MDSSIFLDAIRLINSSTSILLVLPPTPSIDQVASGVGLALALRSTVRRVDVFSPEYTSTEAVKFLMEEVSILPNLVNLREFIIRVGLGSATLESLRYETSEKELRLMLLPKRGYFEPKDVQLSSGSFAYDLIITLGVQQLQALGEEAMLQNDFFAHTPTIAFDTNPAHQSFAQVTLLDPTATSLSEMVVQLLQQQQEFIFHERLATTLLAGIMSGTNGFQAHTVTPKALDAAAVLLTAGARRDLVVQNLFQTKTLPVLQLWGRALAKLQRDNSTRVAHTNITAEDMRVTKTSEVAALGLLEELLMTAQESAVILAVEHEAGTMIHLVLRGGQFPPGLPEDARRVTANYAELFVPTQPAAAITLALRWWDNTVSGE